MLIPLLFMGDVVGRLFRQFAITLAVTILISAVVSDLVPTLSARWLHTHDKVEDSAFGRRSKAIIDGVMARYDQSLTWVLDRQMATMIVAAVTLAITVVLYIIIPKGLFPTQDTGLVQGVSVASQSVSYGGMAQTQQQLAAVLLKDQDVESLSSFIGVDGTNTTLNSGRILINLKPLASAEDSQAATLARLRQEADQIAGVTLYLQPVQDLTIDASSGGPSISSPCRGRIPRRWPIGRASWSGSWRRTPRSSMSPPTCRNRGCRPT